MNDKPDLSRLSQYKCEDITDLPERSIYNNGCQHDWKQYLIRENGVEYHCKCGIVRFEFNK